jgi:hypothetical protein
MAIPAPTIPPPTDFRAKAPRKIETKTAGSGQGVWIIYIITTTTNDKISFDTRQITMKEKENIKIVKTPQ